MNPFDSLTLAEPPLTTTPDDLLAVGRRRLRALRLAMTVVSGTALVGVAFSGLSMLQATPAAPRRATLAAPAPAPPAATAPSAATTGKLTVDNLRAVFESGLGKRLDGAKASTDPSGKTEYELIGSYKSRSVVVSLGRRPGMSEPSCTTEIGYTKGVPCRTESTPSGGIMRIASLSTVGNHTDLLVSLGRKDGTFISASNANAGYSDTGSASGKPSLRLADLRAAVLALDSHYQPAS